MRDRLRCETGFTLLEMLLALLLLSVILGAVYSTFFLSHRAVTSVDDSLVRLQEGRMLFDLLGREIDSAFYSSSRRKASMKIEDRDVHGKQTSRITFTTYSHLRPGLSLVAYHVENRDGIMTLFKKMSDPYKDDPDIKPVEMLDAIESFTVEAKSGSDWVKTWDTAETRALPDELRITITLKVKDRLITLGEKIKPRIGRQL